MLFDFSLKSSLLLIFFVHGIVFSLLLFIKGIQTENKASIWLSFFIFLCVLYICPFMLGYAGWYSRNLYRDILFYIPFQHLFLIPPILFFYIKSLLDKSFTFSTKHFIHFIPAILYLFYSIVVFIYDKFVIQDYYFYADGKDKDLLPWYQLAGFISLAYYLFRSLQLYNQYKRLTFQEVSFADSVMFRWVQRFLIAFIGLILLRLLFFLLNPEWDEFGRKFWYYLSFSILFYYIAICGYLNAVQSFTSFNSLNFPEAGQLKKEPEDILTAEKDPVNVPDLEILKTKIEQVMIFDQAFQNPTLTLADVSRLSAIHPKKISQAINLGFKMNFNDFVNDYRTKAVITKLQSGEHNLQTLLGIAYDCGFNSKSTFNRAFKKHTSLTPKEYLAKYHPK